MSLKDALTEHANVLRSKTGVSDTLSISDMTRLLGDLSWGKENLLTGTSDKYITRGNSQTTGWLLSTSSTNGNGGIPISTSDNTAYTYSATVSNLGSLPVRGELIFADDAGNRINDGVQDKFTKYVNPGEKDIQVTVTRNMVPGAKKIFCDFCVLLYEGQPNPIQIKNERLYEGTEPGIWTPSPYDLDGKIIINPNLAVGTDDYSSNLWGSYVPSNVADKFMGLTVKQVYGGGHIGPVVTVPAGDYTYSFFVKHTAGNGNSFYAKARSFDPTTMQENADIQSVIAGDIQGTDWQRVSFTFKNLKAGSYVFMAEDWPGTVWVAGQKVESGDMLTDYLTKDNRLIDSSDLTGGAELVILQVLCFLSTLIDWR